MTSTPQYVVSTTRRGREYAGTVCYTTFPKQHLVHLLQKAVELEDSTAEFLAREDAAPLRKRAPSPTPLDDNEAQREPLNDLSPPTARKKNGSHLRRQKKKMLRMDVLRKETLVLSAPPMKSTVSYNADHMKVQSTGYCAMTGQESCTPMDLEGLRNAGYVVQSWDGIQPLPLTDDSGTIYAVFAGRPNAEDYLDCCHRVFEALADMPDRINFSAKQLYHRRGNYPSADFGITADQGQPEPVNLHVPSNISERAGRISNCLEMARIVKFCDTSFQKWAPRLHAYYGETMNKLVKHPKYSQLTKPSPHSVFSSMSHNYGRSVVTVPHRDYKNLAFGWCAIVALGEFDSQSGGHLVLHEPRLVVEFPAGSTALIPSAVLTHSNVAIGPTECRASVTFYSSGSVFRFVENDFQTLTSLKTHDVGEYERRRGEMKGKSGKGRWEMGLELYSTIDQLKDGVFGTLSL